MMHQNFSSGGLSFLIGLHALGMMIFLIGLILIIAWAIKYLPQKKLEMVAWWMIGIGIVAAIITCPLFLGHARFEKKDPPAFNGMFRDRPMMNDQILQDDASDFQ